MTFDDGQIRRRIDHDRSDIIGRIVGSVVSLPPETVAVFVTELGALLATFTVSVIAE